MDVFMHRSMRGWTSIRQIYGTFDAAVQYPHAVGTIRVHVECRRISERFDVSAAGASQLVDKLCSRYIERTEDPSDRRAKLLKLSINGAKLVDDGIQERYRWMDELTSKLSAAEQTKISEALTLLTEAARQMEQQESV